jgi:hypothetical protein
MSRDAARPLKTLYTAFLHEMHCAEQGYGADCLQRALGVP